MSKDLVKNISKETASYYSDKLLKHGKTPLGVDWNGKESQYLRFKQLTKIFQSSNHFSINDLGCGYGELYNFLDTKYDEFFYSGIDVSLEMIKSANQSFQGKLNTKFYQSNQPNYVADYGIASGIFNVRLDRSDKEWWTYLETTLDLLNNTSRIAFSFNCLTSYSDHSKKADYLYYADPCRIFDLCKNNYSLNVSLLHDYGLYEFTILVRKDL